MKMLRWIGGAGALGAALLTGCEPDRLTTTEDLEPPALDASGSCDVDDVEWCDEGEDGVDSGSAHFGIWNDLRLFEASGNPYPGWDGVWLGSSVTPSTCFVTGGGAITYSDKDGDGLKESCEYAIARAFAPLLQFHQADGCSNGEPAWAAKRFSVGGHDIVNIAYMPAYYKDCGYLEQGNHDGDSEFIRVSVQFNPASLHWELTEMWLSAHSGTINDRSEFVSGGVFPVRQLAFPQVWVAEDKHANYWNLDRCRSAPLEECGTSRLQRYRFPVDPARNAGSTFKDLMGCVLSMEMPETGRTECFFTEKRFNGWQPGGSPLGGGASAYRTILDQFFEPLTAGARAPLPDPPVEGGECDPFAEWSLSCD